MEKRHLTLKNYAYTMLKYTFGSKIGNTVVMNNFIYCIYMREEPLSLHQTHKFYPCTKDWNFFIRGHMGEEEGKRERGRGGEGGAL